MAAPTNHSTPCSDWRDWETNKADHPAFHYWQRNHEQTLFALDTDHRLGERLYIMACLLWTSLHDQFLGRKFISLYPNWSAICCYYSMLHALRLFWFTSYGSYPTGHFQMGKGLSTNGGGAAADWQRQKLGKGRPIDVTAFQGLLRDKFGSDALRACLQIRVLHAPAGVT